MNVNDLSWVVERASDGATHVWAAAPSVAGVARLDFADGSFVEVDPFDCRRLVGLCAFPTATGDALLRLFVDDELADLARTEQLSRGRTNAVDHVNDDALGVAEAAVGVYLARHDRVSRRYLWMADVLAALARVPDRYELGIPRLPWTAFREQLAIAVGAQRFAEEDIDDIASALQEAHSVRGLNAQTRGALATAAIHVRADRRREDELFAAIAESEHFDDLDVLALRGSTPEDVSLGEPPLDGNLGVAVTDRPNPRPLPIDRTAVPRELDLALDAEFTITRRGDAAELTLTGVLNRPTEALWFRMFDPTESEADEHVRTRGLFPITFPSDGVASARIAITADDVQSGRLAVDIVTKDGQFADPPIAYEYWASATASDLGALKLMTYEPDIFTSHDRSRITKRVAGYLDQVNEPDLADEAHRARPPVLGFVTPFMSPSRRTHRT